MNWVGAETKPREASRSLREEVAGLFERLAGALRASLAISPRVSIMIASLAMGSLHVALDRTVPPLTAGKPPEGVSNEIVPGR